MSELLKRHWRSVSIAGVFLVLAGVVISNQVSPVFGATAPKPKPVAPAKAAPAASVAQLRTRLAAQSTLKKFSNYDQLREYLQRHNDNSSSYGYNRGGMMLNEMSPMMKSAAPSVGAPAPTSASGNDYSKTNVQVEGVDEDDIVKTDGKYVYALSDNNVVIVDGYPVSSASVISKIQFKNQPQGLYLNGNHLIVYGQDYQAPQWYTEGNRSIMPPIYWREGSTYMKVFDVSDHRNPKLVREVTLEGRYLSSRLIGNTAYLVTSNNVNSLDDDLPIPNIADNGKVMPRTPGVPRCNCPDVYYTDINYPSYDLTSLTAINVVDTNQTITTQAYMLGGAQTFYVSPSAMYISYTKYVSDQELSFAVLREVVFPKLKARDQERITKIEAADTLVLSDPEKQQKVQTILSLYLEKLAQKDRDVLQKDVDKKVRERFQNIADEIQKTVVHKIALNQSTISYQGKGEVPGSVLNQFSLDEQNGYLRIATTKNTTWSQFITQDEQQSYSSVYVLDSGMKTVGKVEKLAKGERIYSVRFMQGRAYLVTFKQVDPLFVIDLADPRAPRVLGQLKVPGFSQYLHPFDETTLIGFGKQTEENSSGGVITTGLKLSLFDVSDVANPREIDTKTFGDRGSDSLALTDHKAFLFSKDKQLLVIPAQLRQKDVNGGWGKLSFNGALVWRVTKLGFEERGKIAHTTEAIEESDYKFWQRIDHTNVKRSLYINDELYTLSNDYLKINNLSSLDLSKTLTLTATGSADYQVIPQ